MEKGRRRGERGSKPRILIIANARWLGGLSGGDNIYLNFAKRWPADITIWDMLRVDFKPFLVCYIYRIISGCIKAIFCKQRYDMVYSASDFLMDSLPAYIMKLKGAQWVAGFYLQAPKNNLLYRFSQAIAKPLIDKYANMVFITNNTLKPLFENKITIPVHGGVDMENAYLPQTENRIYDAVFCGRMHPSKGIDDLVAIWAQVLMLYPDAKLAVIGDGDMGLDYLNKQMAKHVTGKVWDITFFGYMGDDRFDIYRQSKCVLYPTRSHFSMAPVEAMACGCILITYWSDVMKRIYPDGVYFTEDIFKFAIAIRLIIALSNPDHTAHKKEYITMQQDARRWAEAWDWNKRASKIYQKMMKVS